ncbi:tetratricopeptide repeat protein [Hydrogenophaga sp.]|uniref:tetratricopeptide repeat protein n=1 Tax=Hydrogenophaga sp. TaxID=1904254 RepID=UPI003D265AE0
MAENNDIAPRALALRKEGRLEEALLAARESVRVFPDDANSWWQLALTHKALKDNDKYEPAIEKVVELAPRFVDGWYSYAAHLVHTQRETQAVAMLEIALALNENHVDSLKMLVFVLKKSKDKDEQNKAIRALETLQELGELNETDLFNLAYLHGEQDNVLAAASNYEKLLRVERHGASFQNLGLMYVSLLRDADAADALRLSLHMRPDSDATKRAFDNVAKRRTELRNKLKSLPSPYLSEEDWYRHYVNPFKLLNLDPLDAQGEIKVQQKARQAVLREVELEEDKVSWMPGLSIDRSSVLALCDRLSSTFEWEAHAWVYNNPPLCEFLSKGDLEYFVLDNRAEEVLELTALMPLPLFEALSEAFARQFSDVLTRAIDKLDLPAIRALLSGRRLVLPEHQERCFESAVRSVRRLAEQLHQLREAAEEKPVNLGKVRDFMQTSAFGRVLPLLTIEFHDIHQSVCQNLRGLSIAHYNRSQDSKQALELLEMSKASASRSGALLHQFETDKEQLNDIIAEAKRHEANISFGDKTLSVTADGVRHGADWIPAKDVQGIRWGMSGVSQSPEVWRFLVAFTNGVGTEIKLAWNVTAQNMDEQRKFMGQIIEAAMRYLSDHTLEHLQRSLERPGGLVMGNALLSKAGVKFTVKGFLWDSEHFCSWPRVRSDIKNGHLVLQANDNPKAIAAIALEANYNAFLVKTFIDKKDN